MNARVLTCIFALGGVVGCGETVHAQGIPCSYSVTVLPNVDCGVFDGPGNPAAMNNLGHVLLTAACGDYDRTYLWTGGSTLTMLPLPPNGLSFAGTDMNDVGQIVGTAATTFAGKRAYVYDLNSGVWTDLPPLNPPRGWSEANEITNNGVVCGYRSIGSKGDAVNPYQAFVWSQSTGFTDFGVMTGPNSAARDISEAGVAVGWTGPGLSSGEHAFIHANGQTTVLPPPPGCVASAAFAISANGTVAIRGRTSGFPGTTLGFAYTNSDYVALGLLGDFQICLVADVGDNGVITGTLRRLNPSVNHGFVWHEGVIHDLNDLTDFEGGIIVRSAGTINGAGRILATAGMPIEDATIVLTPTWLVGDVQRNCRVDIDDLLTVIQWWGQGQTPGDANGDGVVDLLDVLLVIENWTF